MIVLRTPTGQPNPQEPVGKADYDEVVRAISHILAAWSLYKGGKYVRERFPRRFPESAPGPQGNIPYSRNPYRRREPEDNLPGGASGEWTRPPGSKNPPTNPYEWRPGYRKGRDTSMYPESETGF